MDGKTTVKYLQNYIKQKDLKPEANIYDIDLEHVIKIKSQMNESRYPSSVVFEENR